MPAPQGLNHCSSLGINSKNSSLYNSYFEKMKNANGSAFMHQMAAAGNMHSQGLANCSNFPNNFSQQLYDPNLKLPSLFGNSFYAANQANKSSSKAPDLHFSMLKQPNFSA